MALLNQKFRLPILLASLLILSGLSLAGAQEEELILNNPDAYREKHRAAVTFPHDLHVGDLECLTCHHDYENGVNILVEEKVEEENPDLPCAACHNKADSDIHLKEAYHKQCMGCHEQSRLAGSDMGPELCGECHIKRADFTGVESGTP